MVEEAKPRSTAIVVAAVLFEGDRVLLTQRKLGSHLEGSWEFPGGKVEEDEDPQAALVRELREEVGIEARVGEVLDVTFYRYPKKNCLLLFYEVEREAGSPEPQALDVADVRWASLAELRDEDFPPADLSILAKVRARLPSLR
jgi:8-oxo-dGTP diphosphatase